MEYFNPYSGQDFFSFFQILGGRLGRFLTGQGLNGGLASDELQILVLVAISLSAGLVGTFLILRRMTMLANSLSHSILPGIVLAYILSISFSGQSHHDPINLQALALAALFTGIGTTFLTELLIKGVELQEDASTGLVFTSLFATGIILVSLFTRNTHVGLEVVMGNVDALQGQDLETALWVLGLNALGILFVYKELKISTFDPGFARSAGIWTGTVNYFLMVLVAATSVAAFRAVGVLMVLAFIAGPPLAAKFISRGLKIMLIFSGLLGCLASLFGVATARHLLSVYGIPLSTGGLVVCYIGLIFLLVIFLAPETGIIAKIRYRRRIQREGLKTQESSG